MNALMKCSGTEDDSDEAGDDGGEGEHGRDSLDVVLMLRSRASSAVFSAGSVLTLYDRLRGAGAGCVGAGCTNTGGKYLW